MGSLYIVSSSLATRMEASRRSTELSKAPTDVSTGNDMSRVLRRSDFLFLRIIRCPSRRKSDAYRFDGDPAEHNDVGRKGEDMMGRERELRASAGESTWGLMSVDMIALPFGRRCDCRQNKIEVGKDLME